MANQLKMAMVHAINGLLGQGWSHRRIARELGIHRETVARYDRLRKILNSKPANPTPGSDTEYSSKPANATSGSEALQHSLGPPSLCQSFEEIIKKKLEENLSGQRIWQDLVSDHNFTGSYSSVKRFIRRLGKETPLPFRRMECGPGFEAQVDFGSGAWIISNGHKRRAHVLRVILSNSRKGYSEAVLKQDTENFIRVLENAFYAFGGVPKTVVIDNLKAAVIAADWYDPELNPKIVEFARHYDFVILPTKPYMPRHKGKVESGIKYVKNNALKGRIFRSLEEHNRFLIDWERQVADTRIHGTTRKQVGKLFKEAEQKALQPLVSERFPFYSEGRRKVNRDGHIEVAKAYYSTPPEYLGREVWVRWDGHLVRIYNEQLVQIAVHVRAQAGKFNTDWKHLSDRKISSVERGVEHLLAKAMRLGDDAGKWANQMIATRGIEGVRVLQGFLSLSKRHSSEVINRASLTALEAGCFRLRPLRELCKRRSEELEQLSFDDNHPIIRPLSEYQKLIMKVSFKISHGSVGQENKR